MLFLCLPRHIFCLILWDDITYKFLIKLYSSLNFYIFKVNEIINILILSCKYRHFKAKVTLIILLHCLIVLKSRNSFYQRLIYCKVHIWDTSVKTLSPSKIWEDCSLPKILSEIHHHQYCWLEAIPFDFYWGWQYVFSYAQVVSNYCIIYFLIAQETLKWWSSQKQQGEPV